MQFETTDCGQGSLLCQMACNGGAESIPEIKDIKMPSEGTVYTTEMTKSPQEKNHEPETSPTSTDN